MKRSPAFLLVALALFVLFVSNANAQRGFAARTFILDDNAGHTYTLQTPPGMTTNVIYTLPQLPAGNVTAGFVPTGTSGQTLRWNSTSGIWEANSALYNQTSNGYIGIGTTTPQSPMHIVATPPTPGSGDTNAVGFLVPSLRHHVLTVENMNTNGRGQGIAVYLHNPASSNPLTDGPNNDNKSNYVTFYSDNGDSAHIRGRIEGFSYQNYLDLASSILNIVDPLDLINPLNYVSFNLGFDPNFITFNPNFISFTPPTFPTFSGGSFGIDWCSIDLGITSVDYPCGVDITWPSFSGGSIGSLSFSSPISSITTPITGLENPVSINTTFISNIAAKVRALPYKNQAIEIITNPVAAAVKFGVSFLGGVTYESGSGDYAEWLERADHNEKIDLAEVVGVKAGKITKNTEGAEQIMVTSWKPAVLGNMPAAEQEKNFNKVAFMGQIPVKMMSPVRKGDYILPSGKNDGFARAIAPKDITSAELAHVMGTAWEDDESNGIKIVKIAVGLHPTEMVQVIQKQAEQIALLKQKAAEIDRLKQDIDAMKRSSGTLARAKKSTKKSTGTLVSSLN